MGRKSGVGKRDRTLRFRQTRLAGAGVRLGVDAELFLQRRRDGAGLRMKHGARLRRKADVLLEILLKMSFAHFLLDLGLFPLRYATESHRLNGESKWKVMD